MRTPFRSCSSRHWGGVASFPTCSRTITTCCARSRTRGVWPRFEMPVWPTLWAVLHYRDWDPDANAQPDQHADADTDEQHDGEPHANAQPDQHADKRVARSAGGVLRGGEPAAWCLVRASPI